MVVLSSDHWQRNCYVSIERIGRITGRRCIQCSCCELMGQMEDRNTGAREKSHFIEKHHDTSCLFAWSLVDRYYLSDVLSN